MSDGNDQPNTIRYVEDVLTVEAVDEIYNLHPRVLQSSDVSVNRATAFFDVVRRQECLWFVINISNLKFIRIYSRIWFPLDDLIRLILYFLSNFDLLSECLYLQLVGPVYKCAHHGRLATSGIANGEDTVLVLEDIQLWKNLIQTKPEILERELLPPNLFLVKHDFIVFVVDDLGLQRHQVDLVLHFYW